MALPNPVRQKAARSALEGLLVYPATVYAVHYASQSFHRGEQLASPRVTAIGLRQFEGGQITSFSIAEAAELRHLSPQDAVRRLDALERWLLEGFFQFVRENRHARYVHWNMRSAQYGFPALEHRLRVLGGRPESVPEHYRIDLASLLPDLYGPDYIDGTAKLENLARLNACAMGGFLRGRAEAEAFERGRYRDVLFSTLCKVRIISEVATRAHDGTLETRAPWWATRSGPYRIALQKIRENPMISIVAGGAGALSGLLKWFEYLVR